MPTEQSPAPAQVPSQPVALEDRLAQAKARAASLDHPPDASTNPKVPVKPQPSPEETETFRRLTALTKANRELADKVKAYDEKLKSHDELSRDAALFREVTALYKAGKKVEAVAKLAGNENATAEMTLLLADYLGQPDQDPNKPSQAQPNPLEERVKELAKRMDDEQAAKVQAKEQEVLNHARDTAGQFLDEAKDAQGRPQFELCARPDNRQEAYDLALSTAALFAEAKGYTPDQELTLEQSRELMLLAYAEVEREFEDIGKRRYLKQDQSVLKQDQSSPNRDGTLSNGNRPVPAGTVPVSNPAASVPSRRVARTDLNFRAPIVTETVSHNPGHLHPDEALRRIREKYRTGQQ